MLCFDKLTGEGNNKNTKCFICDSIRAQDKMGCGQNVS